MANFIEFRSLNAEEEKEFRNWARENFNPLEAEPSELWHPVVQAECYQMILECIEKGKTPFIAKVEYQVD